MRVCTCRPGDPTFTPTVHRFGARGLSISASAVRGARRWGLYLPDMRMEKAVAAGVGPEYCIRLANEGVPWVGGVNMTACKRRVSLGLKCFPNRWRCGTGERAG